MPYDCQCQACLLHLKVVDSSYLMSDRKLLKIVFNQIDEKNLLSLVDIESSTFKGGYGPFFTVDQASLRLSRTIFNIQSHRHRAENLIHTL